MLDADASPPVLVLAEFGCTQRGDVALRAHLDQTLTEARGTTGCLQAHVWERSGRRFLFVTSWADRAAVDRWVANTFHRDTLMTGFRQWCVEGWFGTYAEVADHARARKCPACGRWTQSHPGYDESLPPTCRQCGGVLAPPGV